MAADLDIVADRQVPFVQRYAFIDQDFTGSGFNMDVRLTKDTTETPIMSLSDAGGLVIDYAGTATVAAHIAAGRLTSDIYGLTNPATGSKYVAGDSVLLTWFSIEIGASLLSVAPYPAERGDDWQGWYDIVRKPPSAGNELIMRGKFTIRAGVTIP